jgi:hypothetical protein
MLAPKSPQAGEYISQVMIRDKRCSGIQPVRRPGSQVVDGGGTLASCCAHGRRGRMERTRCVLPRPVHFPAGRPAQFLYRLSGIFAKLRRRIREFL